MVSSIAFFFITVKLWRYLSFGKIEKKLKLDMLKYSVPLMPTIILWWVINVSDRYMVTYFIDSSANGLYTAASKIPNFIIMFSSIFIDAWQLSAVDEYDSKGRADFFTKVFRVYSGGVFTVASMLIVLCQFFTKILVSKEFFDRVYDNKWFTYLYQDKTMWERYKKGGDENSIASLLSEEGYIELDSSWYMNQSHSYRYFYDMDDFYRFVYKDPVIPRYCNFSPGGCYIINREQILKNSKTFYKNLNTLMEYRKEVNFPAEAYLVERLMPWIFTSRYEVNPWMEDEEEFANMLEKCEKSVEKHRLWNNLKLKRFRLLLGAKEPVFLED